METFDEYKARLRRQLGGAEPVEVLQQTADELVTLLASCPRETARKSPAPGKWSIAQIAAHLAEDEMILGYRMRTVLAEPQVPIVGFDQDRWAGIGRYDQIDPQVSVDCFRVLREWNLALLRRLTPEEWDTFGIHSERGKESIRDMAELYAGHDINHLDQIRKIVGGGE